MSSKWDLKMIQPLHGPMGLQFRHHIRPPRQRHWYAKETKRTFGWQNEVLGCPCRRNPIGSWWADGRLCGIEDEWWMVKPWVLVCANQVPLVINCATWSHGLKTRVVLGKITIKIKAWCVSSCFIQKKQQNFTTGHRPPNGQAGFGGCHSGRRRHLGRAVSLGSLRDLKVHGCKDAKISQKHRWGQRSVSLYEFIVLEHLGKSCFCRNSEKQLVFMWVLVLPRCYTYNSSAVTPKNWWISPQSKSDDMSGNIRTAEPHGTMPHHMSHVLNPCGHLEHGSHYGIWLKPIALFHNLPILSENHLANPGLKKDKV